MTSSVNSQIAGASKVLGGHYDSKSNLLILDVSISLGANQAPLLQKRIFEIHSITMQAPNQPLVELVSARVHESATAVFNAFIEQLKQGDFSFTEELLAKPIPSNTNKQSLVKKVTLGLQANRQSLSGNMQVENNQLAMDNETKSFLRKSVSKVNQAVQPQSIQQLFQLPQLAQWFQNTRLSQKNHSWDHSFSVALAPSNQSDQILEFLQKNFKEFRNRTFELENKLQSLKPKIVEMHALKNKIEQLLEQTDLSERTEELLRENLKQLRQSFSFFTVLESKIILNRLMIEELADLLLVRNLYEHKVNNSGSAAVGAQLTQDWEDFIHKYHLVSSSHNSVEEHLKQSLAISVTNETLDQMVDFDDLEEVCGQLENGDTLSFHSSLSNLSETE